MNYLALTIGPIVETLSESKKTKELFAGSYLFSFFMKRLLMQLKNEKYEMIIPYHQDIDSVLKLQNGVGMFHDRLIVSSNKEKSNIETDILNFIENNLNYITDGVIAIENSKYKEHQELIKEFFKKYLQISFVISDYFSLKSLNNILDVAELHREFIVKPDRFKVLKDQEGNLVNPLVYLQRRFHSSFLKDDAFGSGKKDFPSTLEIALENSINYTYQKQEDEKLEEEALKDVKIYKKYLAVIQADGDKIGSIIKTMDKEPTKVKDFSEKLLEFTKELPDIAKKYSAKVVYAGGDDILAFAPIITEDKKTVFDFLEEIDTKFKNIMAELNIEEAKAVSESFGVSLVYYKKPLYLALNKAIENLFYIAKADDTIRNKAVIELIKHSGQSYVIDIVLTSKIYQLFNEILKIELDEEQSGLPHSVAHNLARSYNLLSDLANNRKSDELAEMLKNFFENNFNKEVHSSDNTKNALELLNKLLFEFMIDYQANINENKEFKGYFEAFMSLLATIKHLRGDR